MTENHRPEDQPPAAGEQGGGCQPKPRSWEKLHSLITVVATVVIALATIFNICVAIAQWNVANRSAVAAEKAATAALVGQQPYVLLDNLGLVDAPSDAPPAPQTNRGVGFVIFNWGNANAIIVSLNLEAKPLDKPPSKQEIETLPTNPFVGTLIIRPSRAQRMPAHKFFLSESGMSEVIARRQHLYFYGNVQYTDFLGNSYLSGFAFEFRPDLNNGAFITIGKPNELNYVRLLNATQ